MSERVKEIRTKCRAASYVDGPPYEDMEDLLSAYDAVRGERDGALAGLDLVEDLLDTARRERDEAKAALKNIADASDRSCGIWHQDNTQELGHMAKAALARLTAPPGEET